MATEGDTGLKACATGTTQADTGLKACATGTTEGDTGLKACATRIRSGPARPEDVEDESHPDPAPAPHLERPAAGDAAAQVQEPRRLDAPLHGGAHGVVHQREFDAVEQHGVTVHAVRCGRVRLKADITDWEYGWLAS